METEWNILVDDYIFEVKYDFEIEDFKDRLNNLLVKGFYQTGNKICIWINEAKFEKPNQMHINFDYISTEDLEEIKEIIQAFTDKVYCIYLLKERYKNTELEYDLMTIRNLMEMNKEERI